MKKIMPTKTMRGVKFFTVEDLVKILGLTPGSVRDYLRKDKIESIKVGVRFYVSEKSLSNFLMCKGIRNLPDSEFIIMINKAVEIKLKEHIDRIAPLIENMVKGYLLKKDTERDLKKVDEENKQLKKVLPGKIIKHLQDRTEEVKKEFEKVK